MKLKLNKNLVIGVLALLVLAQLAFFLPGYLKQQRANRVLTKIDNFRNLSLEQQNIERQNLISQLNRSPLLSASADGRSGGVGIQLYCTILDDHILESIALGYWDVIDGYLEEFDRMGCRDYVN